ncbi:hypothetical protein JYK14_05990 [Siccirubricoccus sp. KC 17139]|uniref:Uncharacterized protein n=1 Tax=Siccirubricoccus soli TaxID=2899147 RepID=A0ABT1D1G9_9PROT|nr:hypothetical protein [Siccirubricoccus soli]MCO6415729.1 hypothetical protein [Siccirubricoccus soli]MCP2681861.1 hypothetical protein [Siccirubricoccus soli]
MLGSSAGGCGRQAARRSGESTPGLGHIRLLMSLPSLAPVADDMAGFIRQHAGEAQRLAAR